MLGDARLINVNGRQMEVAEGITVAQLLEELAVKGPFAVELNRQICPKRLHSREQLGDGDALEIVTIVGGG